MSASIGRQTPEQCEPWANQSALATLEVDLAQRELDLATPQGELRAFDARYLQVVEYTFLLVFIVLALALSLKVAATGIDTQMTRIGNHVSGS